MSKKQIFIVSVYFPPIISVASNRIFAFAKYLDKSEYNITVVTLLQSKKSNKIELPNVDIEYIINKQWIKRATFNKKYPYIIHKLRAVWNILLNIIGVNVSLSWEKQAFKYIDKNITDYQNAIIISSYPTAGPLNVASKIKQKHPEVKWITDLRDGILNNSSESFFSGKKTKENLEKNILINSDIIITVSNPILKYIEQKKLNINLKNYEIRNGFDFEYGNDGAFKNIFTISYIGTFYGKITPHYFNKAIELIIEKKLIPHLQINFIGVGGAVLIPTKLKNYISIIDKVPYNEAIEYMRNSDALLLVIPAGESKGVFSGKIFDYLGVMRPIIPLIDPIDVAAQLIRETGAGKVAEWNSIEEAVESILWTYKLWQKKEFPDFNVEIIKSCHRKYQIEKLNQIIKKL